MYASLVPSFSSRCTVIPLLSRESGTSGEALPFNDTRSPPDQTKRAPSAASCYEKVSCPRRYWAWFATQLRRQTTGIYPPARGQIKVSVGWLLPSQRGKKLTEKLSIIPPPIDRSILGNYNHLPTQILRVRTWCMYLALRGSSECARAGGSTAAAATVGGI